MARESYLVRSPIMDWHSRYVLVLAAVQGHPGGQTCVEASWKRPGSRESATVSTPDQGSQFTSAFTSM